MKLDHTHDASTTSWLDSANVADCDFPIQNLPFSIFRRAGSQEAFRGGVAIGDQVLCLTTLRHADCLQGLAAEAAAACAAPVLNDFLAMGPHAWRALRHGLFALLRADAEPAVQTAVRTCLIPLEQVEYAIPTRIGDYTDFYTSVDHATNIGKLLQPDNPVTPNFKWMPIAYHGRVSSIGISGQRFHRPMGQSLPAGGKAPVYGPCAKMDYELELGIVIGQGNRQGHPIKLADVDQHIFGICLLNDWSARDIQSWEMAPLGPFQAKNFATTISPWIVTLDALTPYRQPWTRPATDPQPLDYLESAGNRAEGAFDIQLEVWLQTPARQARGAGPTRLTHTSFRHQYWSIGQMVAHHTVGGCNLNPGDLLGSGTISGPVQTEAGALIELTNAGRDPIAIPIDDGEPGPVEQRSFLEDGDIVSLRGWCEKPGQARIGFGESLGQVLPAVQA